MILDLDRTLVHHCKHDGDHYEQEHDAETWADADQLHQRIPIPTLDDVQEKEGGEVYQGSLDLDQ